MFLIFIFFVSRTKCINVTKEIVVYVGFWMPLSLINVDLIIRSCMTLEWIFDEWLFKEWVFLADSWYILIRLRIFWKNDNQKSSLNFPHNALISILFLMICFHLVVSLFALFGLSVCGVDPKGGTKSTKCLNCVFIHWWAGYGDHIIE